MFSPACKFALVSVLSLASLAFPASARADEELWGAVETRTRWSSPSPWLPSQLRVWTETRYAGRTSGLYVGFVRGGPIWDVNPNLFVVLQGVIVPLMGPNGSFIREHRIEFEPNLVGRWGDFAASSRNRFAGQWRGSDGVYLYRNLARINYAPVGQWWQPFLSDEVLFDVGNTRLFQNRTFLGLGMLLDGRSRFDISVFARTRRDSANEWVWDKGVMLYLYLDPPRP